ncbi:MAG: HEAT repeat domain-containing protein [Pseudomonadota bacterium]
MAKFRIVVFSVVLTAFFLVCPKQASADKINQLAFLLANDSSYKVRLQAAVTLAEFKNKRSVFALRFALKDKSHTVRGVAVAALGELHDTQSIPILQKVLRTEKHPWVKTQTRKVLRLLRKR